MKLMKQRGVGLFEETEKVPSIIVLINNSGTDQRKGNKLETPLCKFDSLKPNTLMGKPN